MKEEKIDFADKSIDFNKGRHDGEIHGEDDDDLGGLGSVKRVFG